MNFIIHKWVCNANAASNPTQYTKFDKYIVKTDKSILVSNWSEMRISLICVAIFMQGVTHMLDICSVKVLTRRLAAEGHNWLCKWEVQIVHGPAEASSKHRILH